VSELSRSDIAERLERLSEDLDRFPPGVACPWQLGRVFNELAKVAKRDLDQDPVMRSVGLLEEGTGDLDPGGSDAAVGTVRALIGQVLVAYAQGPSERPGSGPTKETAPQPTSSRPE
jgi:hypothetical protein